MPHAGRQRDTPFDVTPVRLATLADLDVRRFQHLHLPEAPYREVLVRNDRALAERLADTKMIAHVDDPTPTVLGVITLAHEPTASLPGAYVQFLRIDGATTAREALRANAQAEPRFEVDAHWVKCFVKAREDWPGNLPEGHRQPRLP